MPALLALPQAADASFIMSPMPASLSSALPYQPAAPAGKPAIGEQPGQASDLVQGILLNAVSGAPGEAASYSLVQDDAPKTMLPEPATIAILGAGLVSLAFLRRAGA